MAQRDEGGSEAGGWWGYPGNPQLHAKDELAELMFGRRGRQWDRLTARPLRLAGAAAGVGVVTGATIWLLRRQSVTANRTRGIIRT